MLTSSRIEEITQLKPAEDEKEHRQKEKGLG